MKFKTVISAYSLLHGEVGKPVGKELVEVYADGISALLALDRAIENPTTQPGQAGQYLIETPDGRRLPFNKVYTEIFGEPPIETDMGFKYPRLKKYKGV